MIRRLMLAGAAAVMLAGCGTKSEAERFGYRGEDLADVADPMFFTLGDGVTNWVPARVLAVYERYELSADEEALLKAAGVIRPSSTFAEIPAGFAKKTEEPWFTTWSRATEAFGQSGVAGFVAHYDADAKTWRAGETYFSTYYDNPTNAEAALVRLEASLAPFHPKKFHRFARCWIAEYVRLRVMGIVGQRPDRSWTCMLGIQDKCEPGCGPWEPVPVQEERVREAAYRAELKAWRERADACAQANHIAIERARAARDLVPFSDTQPVPTGDGRLVYVAGEVFSATNAQPKDVFAGRVAFLSTATGIAVPGRPEVAAMSDTHDVWSVFATNDLYEVRLDMAVPKAGSEIQNGEWRSLVFERPQPGCALPPRPVRK